MRFKLFDIYKEEMIEVTHKTFPKTLYELETRVIGSSRGWIAFMSKLDGTIHLSDVFNLARVITLPFISGISRLPSSVVINISISSPHDQDDDYIVFVKLLGHDMYYCRPNRVSHWTNVFLGGNHALLSDAVYSPRNQRLFSVITGASFLLSFALNMNNRYTRLHLKNYPKMPQSEWAVLASCFKTKHLAESSSCGKCFLVRRYVETYDRGDQEIIYKKTKRFMVFVLDKKVKDGEICATHTQDIGDVCIFFGNNETFCVQASEYPGLKPNTIYYIGYGIGICDIGSGEFNHFTSSTPLDWPLCLLSNFV
ncbi:unnamed protein product [Cochlearia groenlandica]